MNAGLTPGSAGLTPGFEGSRASAARGFAVGLCTEINMQIICIFKKYPL
jgi:hypothetical protein